MEKSRTFLKNKIKDHSKVVVACSGGADSMCLLHLLLKLREEKDIQIVVSHVNHKVRKESDKEEEFVQQYCEKHNILFEVTHFLEYQNEPFSENEARKKRYAFFDKIMKKYKASYLLTAHHGDDLVETVLMRMTRGSNLKGYRGILMESKNENYAILRPLLLVAKTDIYTYNKENSVPFVEDSSNDSLLYTRNRYRKQVLPFLKNECFSIHGKYLQFSEELGGYYDFVYKYIMEKEYVVDNKILINKMKEESDFIKLKTLEILIDRIQKTEILEVSKKKLQDMMKLYSGKNRFIDIGSGYICNKEYGFLEIKKRNAEKEFQYLLDKDVVLENGMILYQVPDVGDSNYEIRLDSEEIILPLIVRSKRDGDKIAVKGLNGSKKVSDIFINEKVKKEERGRIPIVVDSKNTLLWIPGVKKSKFAKDKTEKYDIILKYEVKGKNECEIKTKR